MITTNCENLFLYPFKFVADYADDTRLFASGYSEEECVEALGNAADEHGGIVWYSGWEDEYYTEGKIRKDWGYDEI